MEDRVACKNCWWFRIRKNQQKGTCLAYGFKMKPNDVICCEFARGVE